MRMEFPQTCVMSWDGRWLANGDLVIVASNLVRLRLQFSWVSTPWARHHHQQQHVFHGQFQGSYPFSASSGNNTVPGDTEAIARESVYIYRIVLYLFRKNFHFIQQHGVSGVCSVFKIWFEEYYYQHWSWYCIHQERDHQPILQFNRVSQFFEEEGSQRPAEMLHWARSEVREVREIFGQPEED